MIFPTRGTARAAGRKRYFTGKPCCNGHTAPRYVTTGSCVKCAAETKVRPDSPRRKFIELTRAEYRLVDRRMRARLAMAIYAGPLSPHLTDALYTLATSREPALLHRDMLGFTRGTILAYAEDLVALGLVEYARQVPPLL